VVLVNGGAGFFLKVVGIVILLVYRSAGFQLTGGGG
jgi:hypothetical protein